MSEFRIFCVAAFVGMGLLAVADNHIGLGLRGDPSAALISFGLVCGCAAVALFGKRRSA